MSLDRYLPSKHCRGEGSIVPPEGVEEGKSDNHESEKNGPMAGMGDPKPGPVPGGLPLAAMDDQTLTFHGGMISRPGGRDCQGTPRRSRVMGCALESRISVRMKSKASK
jgi:hypothetical protein